MGSVDRARNGGPGAQVASTSASAEGHAEAGKVERFGVAAGETDVLSVADNADDDPWRALETELERFAERVARGPQPARQSLVDDEVSSAPAASLARMVDRAEYESERVK
jgi:hypothetical protein